MIHRFEGEHAFLSNFHVEPDGTTVEHEFAASKTWHMHEKIRVLSARTPGAAKRAGRKVTLRSDWDQKQANALPTKVNIMRDLVLGKFFDHPELADKLLATGDEMLIEGNHWHDNFWGVCTCQRCINDGGGKGENFLGIILMEVREAIRNA